MKQASLADMTYERALGIIQLRKEALDAGSAPSLSPEILSTSFPMRDAGDALLRNFPEKRAAGFMDAIKGAWKNPAVKSTVIGGGLGALGGLGKTMADDEDDNYVQNMIMGGAGGAALGGAAGLAFNPGSLDDLSTRITKALTPLPAEAITDVQAQEQRARSILGASDSAQQELDLKGESESTIHNLALGGAGLTTAVGIPLGGRSIRNYALDPAPAFLQKKNVADFSAFANEPFIKNLKRLSAAETKAATTGLQSAGIKFDAGAAKVGKGGKMKFTSYSPNLLKSHHALRGGGMTEGALRTALESVGVKPSWWGGGMAPGQSAANKAEQLMMTEAGKQGLEPLKQKGFWSNLRPFGRGGGVKKVLGNARYMPKGKAALFAAVVAIMGGVGGKWGVPAYQSAAQNKEQAAGAYKFLQTLKPQAAGK
jgi:hypothetical protein